MPLKLSVVQNVTFDAATIMSHMGLNEGGYTWPESPGGQYALRGWRDASRMHGDSVPKNWHDLVVSNGNTYSNINTWWEELTPWWVFTIGSGNTTTNAGVVFYGAQLYTRDATTKLWKLRGDNNGDTNTLSGMGVYGGYYKMATYDPTGLPAADLVSTPSFNVTGYCPTVVASRGAPMTWAAAGGAGQTKYFIVHGTFGSCEITDASSIDGFMVTANVRLFGINGAALNGTTQLLAQLGVDAYPHYSSSLGGTDLVGVTYMPAQAGCGNRLIPNDGTPLRLYVTTYTNANTSIDSTVDYYGGTASSHFYDVTSAQLTATPPVYTPENFL